MEFWIDLEISIQTEQALIEAMRAGRMFTTIGIIDGKIHARRDGFWQIW